MARARDLICGRHNSETNSEQMLKSKGEEKWRVWLNCYLSGVIDKMVCVCHFLCSSGQRIRWIEFKRGEETNQWTIHAPIWLCKCFANPGFDSNTWLCWRSQHQTDYSAVMGNSVRLLQGEKEKGRRAKSPATQKFYWEIWTVSCRR